MDKNTETFSKNICFCVSQKTESHAGFEQNEVEEIHLQNINFSANYPNNVYIMYMSLRVMVCINIYFILMHQDVRRSTPSPHI